MVTTLELRPWVPIDDVEHDKSSWEIATDVEFTDIIDSSYDDEVYLDIWYSFIDIPVGVKYYGRAKRHFSDDTESSWTQPKVIEVVEDELTTSLPLDITIDTPMLYVDKDEVLNNDKFVIRSSKYRGEGDGHYSTNWMIYNDAKELVFKSMGDKDNLTSIEVDKTSFNNNMSNGIVIYCTHNSALGIESGVGYKSIVLYDVNFDVVSNTRNILPYTNYELVLKKKVESNVTGVFKVEVHNMSGEVLWAKNFDNDVTNILIPGGMLDTSSSYLVDLYVYADNNSTNSVRVIIDTLELGVNEVMDKDYVYDKVVTYLTDVSDPLMEKGVTVSELTSGVIPGIEDSEDVHSLHYDRSNNTTIDDGLLTNLNLDNTDNDYTYIKILNNNTVVVDTKNDDGYPTFKIYSYNPLNNSVELIQTKTRDSEVDAIGKTNAIVHTDKDNFIYLPTNSDTLYNYNIPDNEITELSKVPNTDMSDGIIFYIGKNRIMIIGGSSNSGYSYNIENKTYLETMKIEERFSNRPLKVNRLINGSYVIVRTTSSDDDVNGDIVYYDTINDRMSIVKVDYDIIPYFDSCLSLMDGRLVLIETKDDVNRYFEFK